MDLSWSGLARRAYEHTHIERKSQFSKVFENALKYFKIAPYLINSFMA
jgi:hypothetical protein